MNPLLVIMLMLCTLWTLLGSAAVWRATRAARRSRPGPGPAEPVSVLKPLCGADADLEANLATFFEQDHEPFELIFGVQRADDPAVAVVDRLRARYPRVSCRLVIHSGLGGKNPKVDNLRGMLPFARHDLLLVSDSNVRAPRHYVREMVATRSAGAQPAGLVTNLFAGTGERGLGAALENVQLNGFCAAGAALPTLLGDALVVGKSMLFSRSSFERLGGFARVADVLAEDWLMGKMFQHGGHEVRIAPSVLENVTSDFTLRAFLARHLRWAMLRWRLRPAAYALEPLTSPLLLLPAALAVLGPAGLPWTVALLVLRDAGQWWLLRGPSRICLPLLLAPLRDLAMLAVWLRAPFKRHVVWRGTRVRLGAGTLLFETA